MHFHTVRADQICFEDLKSNEPDAEIGMKSRKTRLGEADAFISHSWHDDPVEKWRALQAWRRKFRQENHGVEPKLWIDKYCIDQNDVENSLACLPIYLASCSRLVVICGETYLERLWCITELFVFLEMGGSPSNLEVIVLPDPCDKIAQKIKNFAPENARSFDMETTDILLGVLEAGRFGLEGIRKLVQDRFVPGSWQLVFETDPKAVTARSSSSLAAPDASGNDAKAVALRSTSSLKVPEAMINMVMQTKAYAAGSSSPKAPEAVVNAVVNETKAQACTSRSGSSLKAPSFISSETKAGTSRSSSSLAMRVLNFEALGPQLHPPAVREEDGSSEESLPWEAAGPQVPAPRPRHLTLKELLSSRNTRSRGASGGWCTCATRANLSWQQGPLSGSIPAGLMSEPAAHRVFGFLEVGAQLQILAASKSRKSLPEDSD